MVRRALFCVVLLLWTGLSAQVLQLKGGEKVPLDSIRYESGKFITPQGSIVRDQVKKVAFVSGTTESAAAAIPKALNDTLSHYMAVAESVQVRYPDAGGIVLLDHSIDSWQKSGANKSRYHFIGKVLKPSQKEWGTLSLWFEEERDRVTIERARSISPKGEILEYDPKSVTVNDPASGMEFFSRGKVMSATIPGVEVGSLVEFIYEREEFNPYDSLMWFPRFYFQDFNPVVDSRFEVVIPKDHNLFFKTYSMPSGATAPKITESGENKVYVWEMHNLEPLIEEPAMPNYREIAPGIQGALFEKYDYLYDWLGSFQKSRIAVTPDIEAEVNTVIAGKTTLEEKISAIYLYAQRNIRYISIKGSISSSQTGHPAFETFKNKYGDCTDKSILFATMLKVIGVECEPLIIMTNDAGQVDRSIPQLMGNHAISMVHLNGKELFLDATATTHRFPYFRADDVDVSYVNAIARKSGRTAIPPPSENAIAKEIDLVLDGNGTAQIVDKLTFVGNMEANWRGMFQQQQENRLPVIFSNWAVQSLPGAKLKDYHLNNLNDMEQPFSLDFSYSAPKVPLQAGPYWVVTPPGLDGEYGFSETGAPTRKYDLVYQAPEEQTHTYRFILPAGASVVSLPDSVHIRDAWFLYRSSYTIKGDTLTFADQFQRLARVVPVADYQTYRNDLAKLQKALTRQVFLKRPDGGQGAIPSDNGKGGRS